MRLGERLDELKLRLDELKQRKDQEIVLALQDRYISLLKSGPNSGAGAGAEKDKTELKEAEEKLEKAKAESEKTVAEIRRVEDQLGSERRGIDRRRLEFPVDCKSEEAKEEFLLMKFDDDVKREECLV